MTKMSAPKPELISRREFARRDGCSERLVRNALRDGDLRAGLGGKLDAALVGSGWRLTNRRRADGCATKPATPQPKPATPQPVRTDLSAAAARLAATGVTPPLADSEARKEHYLALLRQLEYEEKVGLVLSVATTEEVVGKVLGATRARFLAIPSKAATQMVGIGTPAEAFRLLTELVHQALDDLAATEVVMDEIEGRSPGRRMPNGHGHA